MSNSQNKSGWGCGTLAGWGTFLAGLAAIIGILINLNNSSLPPRETTTKDSVIHKDQPPPRTPTPTPAPNISGKWTLTNPLGTWIFILQQNGSDIVVQEYDSLSNLVGKGNGTIQNRMVILNLTEAMLYTTVQSQSSLELSQDGTRLTGQIYSQGASYTVTLFKQ